jgi:hypothetical protein
VTWDELVALPVGTLVKVTYDENDSVKFDPLEDVGEIIKSGPLQVDVMFPNKTCWITKAWVSFIECLEVEE